MNPAAEAWPVTAAIVGIGREMRSATKDRSFESMMLFSTSLILVSSMSSSLLVEIRLRCTIVLKMMPYLHCNPILMRTDCYGCSSSWCLFFPRSWSDIWSRNFLTS
ncbi:uncharacterized protein LOC106389839 isoform X3 [Brassica napus]|uniref:uncharacterized protein LOC106296978 isoform X4 n=1 Tax=Brassica oleracea var. oleracea TaxID=109376 RepID=UPI0006A6D27F|nr:PREDICTED: uncharacterized protein LOC106296978 isoform X4 [Brassica oleracea var. oleracea]XP_013677547.1 uncharacterized protein LOC106382126 isoform X3 [Brassica napus]XP_013685637.1 uncharacterized protein LOC106389839 isoform X3 [Brassica napus]